MTAPTPPRAALIVTAHPDLSSLTHGIATALGDRLARSGAAVQYAHLAQEGFDPRFDLGDRAAYARELPASREVQAEQQRLDQVTDVVLVFPVYWWSMPALLKGWVDRVFIAGWAFDLDESGRVIGSLSRLRMHLIPVSATAARSFEKHGYTASFSTQIEHGIIGYCGLQQGATAFVWESETPQDGELEDRAERAVAAVTAAVLA